MPGEKKIKNQSAINEVESTNKPSNEQAISLADVVVRSEVKKTLYDNCNDEVETQYQKIQAATMHNYESGTLLKSPVRQDKARKMELALRNAEYAAIKENKKFATVDAFLNYKPDNDPTAMSLREVIEIDVNYGVSNYGVNHPNAANTRGGGKIIQVIQKRKFLYQ